MNSALLHSRLLWLLLLLLVELGVAAVVLVASAGGRPWPAATAWPGEPIPREAVEGVETTLAGEAILLLLEKAYKTRVTDTCRVLSKHNFWAS